jgi:hypothetical protein
MLVTLETFHLEMSSLNVLEVEQYVEKRNDMSVTFEVSQDTMFPYRAAARVGSLHHAFTLNCMMLQEELSADPPEVS